jgi:hypothetical protein
MWIFKNRKADINIGVGDFHIPFPTLIEGGHPGKLYGLRLVPTKNPSCKSAGRGMYYYEQI